MVSPFSRVYALLTIAPFFSATQKPRESTATGLLLSRAVFISARMSLSRSRRFEKDRSSLSERSARFCFLSSSLRKNFWGRILSCKSQISSCARTYPVLQGRVEPGFEFLQTGSQNHPVRALPVLLPRRGLPHAGLRRDHLGNIHFMTDRTYDRNGTGNNCPDNIRIG